MSAVTITRTLAATAIIVALAVVLWTGGRGALEQEASPEAADRTPIQTVAGPPRSVPVAAPESAVAAKLGELNAMSETYRNTTFLTAIRDSGYVCHTLERVYGGVNDSATWTATCSQLLAYTVRVSGDGTLHVEPMLDHSDSIVGPVTPDFGNDGNGPVPVLPPQPLVEPPPR
jgi:hypothetical protein